MSELERACPESSPSSSPPDTTIGGRFSRVVMVAAAVLVLALQILAIDRQSLIGDAPYHLLAGDQALRDGVNLLNFEHPEGGAGHH